MELLFIEVYYYLLGCLNFSLSFLEVVSRDKNKGEFEEKGIK